MRKCISWNCVLRIKIKLTYPKQRPHVTIQTRRSIPRSLNFQSAPNCCILGCNLSTWADKNPANEFFRLCSHKNTIKSPKQNLALVLWQEVEKNRTKLSHYISRTEIVQINGKFCFGCFSSYPPATNFFLQDCFHFIFFFLFFSCHFYRFWSILSRIVSNEKNLLPAYTIVHNRSVYNKHHLSNVNQCQYCNISFDFVQLHQLLPTIRNCNFESKFREAFKPIQTDTNQMISFYRFLRHTHFVVYISFMVRQKKRLEDC